MMQHIDDKHIGLATSAQEAVDVKFWKLFIDRNHSGLYHTLSCYSLDNGPYRNLETGERIRFRFMAYDWEKTIKPLLVRNAIPFETIASFRINAMQHVMKKKIFIAEDDLDVLFAL